MCGCFVCGTTCCRGNVDCLWFADSQWERGGQSGVFLPAQGHLRHTHRPGRQTRKWVTRRNPASKNANAQKPAKRRYERRRGGERHLGAALLLCSVPRLKESVQTAAVHHLKGLIADGVCVCVRACESMHMCSYAWVCSACVKVAPLCVHTAVCGAAGRRRPGSSTST